LPYHVEVIDLPAPMLPEGPPRAPFTSPDWLYELQFAGTRCTARVESGAPGDLGRVRLRTAQGEDAAAFFPEIVRGLAALPGGPHVLDGTASALHGAHPSASAGPQALCVCDLLVHGGEDLCAQPLVARQARMRDLLHPSDRAVLLAAGSLPADAGLLRAMLATGMDAAGVVAKRKASPYRPGTRSADWALVDTASVKADHPRSSP